MTDVVHRIKKEFLQDFFDLMIQMTEKSDGLRGCL